MKAIEFVREHGLEVAREALSNMPKDWDYCCLRIPDFNFQKRVSCIADCVDMIDLKQIVDAFELVGKVGGLDNAKTFDESCMYCIAHLTTLDNLQKAINLVEQCNV